MAVLTMKQWHQAVLEAIQQLTTLDSNGKRRDFVTVSVGDISTSYAASQLPELWKLENELANRRCNRNRRKRTSPDFSY